MEDKKPSTKQVISVSRVHTIMKSTSDEVVSKESTVIMSKAAEMFIRIFTQECYNETNSGKKLDYKHLSNIVHEDEKYGFLRDILPKKITVLQFKRIMAQNNGSEERTDEDSSSSDDDSSTSEDTTSGSSSE